MRFATLSWLLAISGRCRHASASDRVVVELAHPRPAGNYLLGLIAGFFFPVPLSLVRITHQGHHLRNRTDFELFDLYYPTDSKFVRFVQWYGILCGMFWPWVPIGAGL